MAAQKTKHAVSEALWFDIKTTSLTCPQLWHLDYSQQSIVSTGISTSQRMLIIQKNDFSDLSVRTDVHRFWTLCYEDLQTGQLLKAPEVQSVGMSRKRLQQHYGPAGPHDAQYLQAWSHGCLLENGGLFSLGWEWVIAPKQRSLSTSESCSWLEAEWNLMDLMLGLLRWIGFHWEPDFNGQQVIDG